MKHSILLLAFALSTALASPASAACFADYKAKQDNPLKLHYGVIQLPDRVCGSTQDARPVVSRRIGADGWTLLNVLSIFDQNGLEQRKASAGEFFLRY
ncbi:hypothetical protein [Maritimibacter dapengensis]|uniref:Secreted protein n=1 Tax=Maritimibacter dapengensis TaxID=2836868 RepID=A0ABS6T4P3_9RHOB|nr:hypothetical protein [Maritimibacter dapengensis]MBV7380233.1 hypothetical protein [Maritimibacter dapengensis]